MKQRGREKCPFVNTPFEDCYVRDPGSLAVESAIRYCGGDFENCAIYVRHRVEGLEGAQDGVSPPGSNLER